MIHGFGSVRIISMRFIICKSIGLLIYFSQEFAIFPTSSILSSLHLAFSILFSLYLVGLSDSVLSRSPHVFHLISSLVSEHHGTSSEASVGTELVYTISRAFLFLVSEQNPPVTP